MGSSDYLWDLVFAPRVIDLCDTTIYELVRKPLFSVFLDQFIFAIGPETPYFRKSRPILIRNTLGFGHGIIVFKGNAKESPSNHGQMQIKVNQIIAISRFSDQFYFAFGPESRISQ
jgi:hypothetical protein